MDEKAGSDNLRQEVTKGRAKRHNSPKRAVRPRAVKSQATLRRELAIAAGEIRAPLKDPMRVRNGAKGAAVKAGKGLQPVFRSAGVRETQERLALKGERLAAIARAKRAVATVINAQDILIQGTVIAANYLVDLVDGKHADAPHSVRVDAAKAIIDRAMTLGQFAVKQGQDANNPMNQWSIQQLDAFIEGASRTIEADEISDTPAVESKTSDNQQPEQPGVSGHSPECERSLSPEQPTPPHPPDDAART